MNKLLFVFLLVFIAISVAKIPIRGKKFVKCFRACKKEEEKPKNCIKKCLKRPIKPIKPISKPKKFNSEEKLKMMADYGYPKSIIKKMEKHRIPMHRPIDLPMKPSSDSEDSNTVKSEKLWAQYRQELFSFFRQGNGGSMKHLQLLGHPYPVDDDTLSMFLNYLPKWSSTYERTNDQIPENYDDFMMNINVNEGTWTPRLDQLGQELDEKTGKLQEEYDKCYQKYEAIQYGAYKPNYETYKATRCYTLQRAESEQKRAFFMFEQEKRKLPGGGRLYDAKTKYFSTLGEFKWISTGKISNFREAAQQQRVNGFEVTIEKTSSTTIQTSYSSSFGFDVSATIKSVKLGVNGQFEKTGSKLNSREDQFHVKFGAQGYIAMPVWPGSWMDLKLMEIYKNGPFIKPGNYWGPNGSLRLIPKTLFLVVGPKVEMWVSASDKEEIEKAKNSSINASVGYMEVFNAKFDFKKGSTFKSEKAGNELYKIEIVGNDYNPQILAIDYDTPNYYN